MTFEWHGGALWMILGGRFYTNTTWIEGVLAPTVKLNGAALGPGPVMGWARPNQGGALALVSYSDIPNLAIGTNTLTISIAPASQTTVDRAMIDGLIVEWPYAA